MDIAPYLARVAFVLPLLCGMIVLGLWAAKRFFGLGLSVPGNHGARRAARVTETLLVGSGIRLTVVEFGGRRLLLALNRGAVITVAEAAAEADHDV